MGCSIFRSKGIKMNSQEYDNLRDMQFERHQQENLKLKQRQNKEREQLDAEYRRSKGDT